jgi:hypothetical protein
MDKLGTINLPLVYAIEKLLKAHKNVAQCGLHVNTPAAIEAVTNTD